jgi:hypothetical protein
MYWTASSLSRSASTAPLVQKRGLAGLGDGAHGEQRHVALVVPSRGDEGREAPGERGGGEREDEALPGDRELVAERGQRRRQLARPRGLVGDRRHRVRGHRSLAG